MDWRDFADWCDALAMSGLVADVRVREKESGRGKGPAEIQPRGEEAESDKNVGKGCRREHDTAPAAGASQEVGWVGRGIRRAR